MRHALLLNAFSLLTFIAAVFFIWQKGLHLSIEFTGGTVMEITYPQTAPLDSIREQITKIGYTDTQIQNFGSSRDVKRKGRRAHKDSGRSKRGCHEST